MKIFLDCVYLISCDFYKAREKEIFKSSGLILMGVLFTLNLILLTLLVEPYYSSEFGDDFLYGASLLTVGIYLLIFLPLLYLRYFRFTNYEAVLSEVNDLSANQRNFYFLLAYAYAIITVVITFSFIFYRGGAVNGWW